MSDEIPQWAFDLVDALADKGRSLRKIRHDYTIVDHAFARYIMQHEKPPVDKDVLAVREILAEASFEKGSSLYNEYMNGNRGNDPHVQDALAAYRKHKQ